MMLQSIWQSGAWPLNPRPVLCAGLLAALTACGGAEPQRVTPPPPRPAGVETVAFVYPDARDPASVAAAPDSTTEAVASRPAKTAHWGIKDGEALPLLWEDLMPEGSEAALIREYEDFYAMLEQRYAANSTTLADAADPYAAIAEGSELDFMPQLGSFDTVTELDGQLVRIPGYIVPFDFNSKFRQREFLFVPYMGACIHTPPPPPNQIIFIRADPPIRVKDIWAPYWIEGTLYTETVENALGDAAYALQMSRIEPYLAP